ncbi:TRMT2A [Symbiodinium sp. CCMP2592]|nr:TRMT2A [Symbiodinium sp. CCMP2592]
MLRRWIPVLPSWPSASAPGAWSEAVISGTLATGVHLVVAVLPSQDQGAKVLPLTSSRIMGSRPGSRCPSIEALGAVGEAGGAAPLVAKLCRCVSGSMQTKAQKSLRKGVENWSPVQVQAQIALIADSLKLLCSDQQERKIVAASGGVRTLLALSNMHQESRDPGRKDVEEGARNDARQALAQILIVMNPQLLQYQEQLDAVRPMLALLEHRHELLQFEGCLALTNLLSSSEELRSFALQSGAWSKCKDLLFSDHEEVQRAGLEAMCNLTMAEEVAERFALGKAENELKIFGAFCTSEIERQQIAATGALAILSGHDEVAVRIADCQQCLEGLLHAVLESDPWQLKREIPAVELRAVSAAVGLRHAEGAEPPESSNCDKWMMDVNQEIRRAIFAVLQEPPFSAQLRRKCSRAAELLQPLVPVAMKKLCKALRDCVRASAFSIFERGKGWQRGYWRMVMVRQSTAEELLVMVQTAKLEDAQREALAAEVIAALTKAELQINVVSIYLQFNDEISDAARPGAPLMHIHGDAQLRMQLLGLSFNIGPLSFYQANSSTCALLYERALEWLRPENDVAVLDVCCGVGTIGLCASRRCRRVIGIELIPEAVEAAKANAALNKVDNTEWIAGASLVG